MYHLTACAQPGIAIRATVMEMLIFLTHSGILCFLKKDHVFTLGLEEPCLRLMVFARYMKKPSKNLRNWRSLPHTPSWRPLPTTSCYTTRTLTMLCRSPNPLPSRHSAQQFQTTKTGSVSCTPRLLPVCVWVCECVCACVWERVCVCMCVSVYVMEWQLKYIVHVRTCIVIVNTTCEN